MTGTVGIGMIGARFMGKAHTNAWRQASIFFDPPLKARLRIVCARSPRVHEFARRWGWEKSTTDWREVIEDPEVQIVDISNYLAGEIESVAGVSRIFVSERERPEGGRARVEIEDASIFVCQYANGAIGHFEATRFANGRKNGNIFEINGEYGSLYFNLEDMSRLWYFDSREPKYIQGWKQISVWEEVHPYMNRWWVPGCAIGYEHTFANQAADILFALAEGRPVSPTFEDGLKCQLVLDAVLEACQTGQWVKVKKPA